MKSLINNKKYLTFILIGLLTTVIGISLSFIMFDLSGSDNSIQTGQVSMTYTEPSNEVLLKDALPKSDESGKNQSEYFEFSVMSNITTNETDDMGYNMPYEISLSKTTVDKMFQLLKDEDVKVYLTEIVGEEEQTVVSPIVISELSPSDFDNTSYKIYDTKNSHHNNQEPITTKYRLRFWIDENVDATNWYKENKYEYRFVVNINGYAEKNTELTLSQRIKKLYTPENGAAKIDDGVYYLQGPEVEEDELSIEQELLEEFGTIGSVYLYRNSDSTFNVNLLENHLKDFVINELEVTEEEYKQITDPFGGYLNAIIGMQSGIIDGDMQYVDGKTIDDIPSLEEIMDNEDIRAEFCEMIGSTISEMYAIDSKYFLDTYYKNEKFNKILLDENLELGLTNVYNMTELAQQLKLNFGSVSDGFIAESYGLLEYDQNNVPQLIEGKKIPKLEEIYITGLKKEVTYITNNYVKLNENLYKIISINKDNSINLISVGKTACYDYDFSNLENNECSQITGLIKNEKYEEIIKNTSLEKIIKLQDSEYIIIDKNNNQKKEKLNGYTRFLTRDDFYNTFTEKTYLIGNITINELKEKEGYSYYSVSEYTKKDEELRINFGSSISEVITIEDIMVVGEGTKDNPFMLEEEIISTPEQIARYYKNENLIGDSRSLSSGSYSYQHNLKFLNTIDREHSYYISGKQKINSPDNYYANQDYDLNAVGIKINNNCYYLYYDNKLEKAEPINGECQIGPRPTVIKHPSGQSTFSYNETIFAIEAENADSYQWQYFSKDGWVNLEDITGRIEGSKTPTLTLHPDSIFNEKSYFRCLAFNKLGYVASKTATMNMVLTDGEWVYTEIEDTNKFKIIEHVQTDMSKSYSLTPNGKTGLEGYPMYDLVVPSTINGDIITNVSSVYGKYWDSLPHDNYHFLHEMPAYLTKVTFEEGIEVIGNGLASSDGTFKYGSIEEVVLPTTIKEIGGCAFYRNYITKINLEDAKELTGIGIMAFAASSIEEVILAENITIIGYDAFNSNEIKTLTFKGAKTGTSKLSFIGERAFAHNSIEEVIIPASVKEIYSSCFMHNEISKIEFVDQIGNPSQLESIFGGAFEQNQKNEEVIIPASVKVIGNEAFQNLGIENLIIKGAKTGASKLEKIGHYAFLNNKIKSFTSPPTMEWIGEEAFSNNEISDLTLKEGIKEINRRTFYNNKLEEVKLPSTLETVGPEAFHNNSIKEDLIFIHDGLLMYYKIGTNNIDKIFVIPEGAKIIKSSLIEKQEINEIIMPDTVETIEKWGFSKSTVKKVKFSKKLSTIDQYAFYKNQIEELEIPGNIKTIRYCSFYENPINKLILKEGIENIDKDAFYNAKLTELEIPGSIKTIGENAFYNSPLTNLTLHEGLSTISSYAFYNAKLTELKIPSTVDYIYNSAFYNSQFTNLQIYGKTSMADFESISYNAIKMANGYEPEFMPGTLE